MVPLVYSPAYNISAFGLERWHPFDGCKYGRIRDWLVRQGLRRPADFVAPQPATSADLLTVHTPAYLARLRQRRVLAHILEVPFVAWLPAWLTDWRVLQPMRLATGGTLTAARLARDHGLAINLGGGFHHAGPARGHGFCAYADVPFALAVLHREGPVGSAVVVDTDAHQGDGTADALRAADWAHILDFFEDDLFPWPKVAEDVAVPLPPGTTGAAYLDRLWDKFPAALDAFKPDLILYNAGSDVLASDPLTHLALTPADLADRDLYVVSEARRRGVAVAMVLSGGYGPASWLAHAQSIEGILTRFDRPM